MVQEEQVVPIIWKKSHSSINAFHKGTIDILLDKFVKKYSKRFGIQSITVDFEMPKNAAGYSNGFFIIKLNLTLKSGKVIFAKSNEKSIPEAMKKITLEIKNQIDLTDRQKHLK
jgi:hypothetical protein